MKKNAAKYGIFTLVMALVILFDRLTKVWAVENLMGKAPIELIPNVFELRYLENFGMAFGLLQNKQVFFYVTTAVILLLVLYLLYRTPMNKRFLPMLLTISMMTGGAVGNLVDRISTKYVVDFLYFKLINFPIFNVADSFVTLSSIALFVLLLFVYKDEEFTETYGFRKKKAPEKAADETPEEVTEEVKEAADKEETEQ